MSQMKRVLDVVQDLRSLADSIAALAGTAAEEHTGTAAEEHAGNISDRTEPATTSTATTAQEAPQSPEQLKPTTDAAQSDEERTGRPQPATEAERPQPATEAERPQRAAQPKLSITELRAYVAERSTPENRPKIRAILARYGVAKLTDLADEHYDSLVAEVDAL
jgi:hypothetical protein